MVLQEHGRIALTKLAEQVGLSAPSVVERVKKLEDGGIITGYHAAVDARLLGKDVTAFIGVSIGLPRALGMFERSIAQLDDVLECHHVTGEHTVLLKVKTNNTEALEAADPDDPADRRSLADRDHGSAVHANGADPNLRHAMRSSTIRGNGKRHRHAIVKNTTGETKRA